MSEQTMPEKFEPPRPIGRMALCVFAAFFLLPFIYLTSLALLYSACAHGSSLPSRGFLKAYAAPSNVMVTAPGIGGLYASYFRICVRLSKADYDPNKK